MRAIETGAPPPAATRSDYLDHLPEPQELYLEVRVRAGRTFALEGDGAWAGYAVAHDGALVELHCVRPERLGAALETACAAADARRIVAKTFDAPLMAMALERAAGWSIIGRLYRDIVDDGFQPTPGLEIRPAAPDELDAVNDVDRAFFSDPEVTAELIGKGGLLLYLRDGEILGCGLAERVIAGRPDIDIGMAVAHAHRGHGLGAYIIAHLKRVCLDRGERPICGHHAKNHASRRSLERAGFASRHRLVEFRL